MKSVGIVCEYNPFHSGHGYQISKAREMGAECIICVMSGNFTQRGEAAIADKYTRAKAAILCGADIVLELPFPYSSLSAEGFARAGAYILDCVGADTLLFGSECGDISAMREASEVFFSSKFQDTFRRLQKDTNTSTHAYFEAYRCLTGKDADFLSNDILGISYIGAINSLGLAIKPETLKRVGSAYNDENIGGKFASATALRKLIYSGKLEECKNQLPDHSYNILSDSAISGNAPADTDKFFSHIKSFFLLHSAEEIKNRAIYMCGGKNILDDGDGIVNRIISHAEKFTSQEDFYSSLFNSRYTDARIRRVMLYSLFGISDIYRTKLPEFTLLLGASDTGTKYLSDIRKSSKINIVTKPADMPESIDASIQRHADKFYSLCMPKEKEGGFFLKKSPVILK